MVLPVEWVVSSEWKSSFDGLYGSNNNQKPKRRLCYSYSLTSIWA
jgi:hypothetical protein